MEDTGTATFIDFDLYTPSSDQVSPYKESAEGIEISRERALQELAQHDHEGLDAFDEYFEGPQDTYQATEVLGWLGY